MTHSQLGGGSHLSSSVNVVRTFFLFHSAPCPRSSPLSFLSDSVFVHVGE